MPRGNGVPPGQRTRIHEDPASKSHFQAPLCEAGKFLIHTYSFCLLVFVGTILHTCLSHLLKILLVPLLHQVLAPLQTSFEYI